MRDHSRHIQVDREEALRIIAAHTPVMTETELVPVTESVGRILAEDGVSQWESPNTLTCALDSVAIHWDDFAEGMPDTSDWERGRDWTFANTGVAMPAGFDAAVAVEEVIFSENDEKVTFRTAPVCRYDGTIPPGKWMKKGELLAPRGKRITPMLAAYISRGNNTRVRVLRRPVVAFIPTGSELVHPGPEVPAGRNVESTSIMITEKVRSWGGEPLVFEITRDDRDAIKQAITTQTHFPDC